MKKRRDLSTKPYYKCLICPDFRTECGGLPTRDMTMQEWCEMVRDVIDYYDLDMEDVAKKSDNSLKTIERIHALIIDKDMLRGTTRRVEIAVFGHAGNHKCFDKTAEGKIAALNEVIAALTKERDRYAKIIDKYIYAE